MAEPVTADDRGGAGFEARAPQVSEIARRRAARDLWISWSHVGAAAAGAVAFAALAFAGGLVLGQRWATPVAAPPPSLTAEVPRDELLRLLARIDGNASGPASALTFPDALRGQGGPPGAPPTPGQGPTTLVAGGPAAVSGDPLPGAGFTVVLAATPDETEARRLQAELAAAGIAAFVAAELVDGAPRFRVAVGRHLERDAAVAAARLLGSAGAPVVEALVPAQEPAPPADEAGDVTAPPVPAEEGQPEAPPGDAPPAPEPAAIPSEP
jgi:hypothetical protein